MLSNRTSQRAPGFRTRRPTQPKLCDLTPARLCDSPCRLPWLWSVSPYCLQHHAARPRLLLPGCTSVMPPSCPGVPSGCPLPRGQQVACSSWPSAPTRTQVVSQGVSDFSDPCGHVCKRGKKQPLLHLLPKGPLRGLRETCLEPDQGHHLRGWHVCRQTPPAPQGHHPDTTGAWEPHTEQRLGKRPLQPGTTSPSLGGGRGLVSRLAQQPGGHQSQGVFVPRKRLPQRPLCSSGKDSGKASV